MAPQIKKSLLGNSDKALTTPGYLPEATIKGRAIPDF